LTRYDNPIAKETTLMPDVMEQSDEEKNGKINKKRFCCSFVLSLLFTWSHVICAKVN
jgi:hypothetical protein